LSTVLALGAGVFTNMATSDWTWPAGVGLVVFAGGWVGLEVWRAVRHDGLGDSVSEREAGQVRRGSLDPPVVSGSRGVFVSYARADCDYVEQLAEHLRGGGLAVRFDQEIATGLRWDHVLESQIESCGAMVVVMSAAARDSYWVGVELEYAGSRGRPIFPLLLDGEPLFGLGVIQYESVVGGRMPSPGFVQRLHEVLSGVDVSRPVVAMPGRPRHVGVVPNAADTYQQRRVDERLDQALADEGPVIVTQILSGLGGVGKTQLAAATVRQLVARGELDDVVWVSATSPDAIVSTLADAASTLAGAATDDPVGAARRFLAWLATTPRRWLIVFDDLTHPADLDGWWPPTSSSGRVLVTTRRRDDALLRHGQLVDVEQFTAAEARSYLTDKFSNQPWRLVETDELAADLGCLPVALAQAAAYIADRDLTCAQYRQRLAAHSLTALGLSAWPDEYGRAVAATLSLVVDAADQLEPVGLARPLLLVLSLLEPNGIPAQIVTSGPVASYLEKTVQHPINAEQAWDALGCLRRLSAADLTSPDPNGTGLEHRRVRVHALVQRAAREQALAEQLAAAALAGADALIALWPDVERDPDFVQMLRANTAALRIQAEDRLWAPDCHAVLVRAGQSLGEAGLVAAATAHFEHLVVQAQRRLGPDHPSTLDIRNRLADWRGEAGDPAGAATAAAAVLADGMRVLGPDHPATLAIRNNLAYWQGEAGDPAGAVAAFESLLADRLRVLGPDDPDTLGTRHHLARLRGDAGDAVGAVAAFQALLADRLRVLGPDHPDTLDTRASAARWRGEAGDPAGAVAAFEALLADRMRVLGPDHPDTLNTRGYLAYWQGEAGDPAGAVAAFEALLADRMRLLGPDHPRTLTARGNLARWQGEAGDPAGAVTALEALLTDRLRVLGPNHPDTLAVRKDIARWRARARVQISGNAADDP
jgi:hypothetical protein